jgi:hypothetical protein
VQAGESPTDRPTREPTCLQGNPAPDGDLTLCLPCRRSRVRIPSAAWPEAPRLRGFSRLLGWRLAWLAKGLGGPTTSAQSTADTRSKPIRRRIWATGRRLNGRRSTDTCLRGRKRGRRVALKHLSTSPREGVSNCAPESIGSRTPFEAAGANLLTAGMHEPKNAATSQSIGTSVRKAPSRRPRSMRSRIRCRPARWAARQCCRAQLVGCGVGDRAVADQLAPPRSDHAIQRLDGRAATGFGRIERHAGVADRSPDDRLEQLLIAPLSRFSKMWSGPCTSASAWLHHRWGRRPISGPRPAAACSHADPTARAARG